MDAIKIMVIDDEPGISESLAAHLEDHDYAVTTCATAEDALIMMQKTDFALAIVDLRLPGMHGEAFILTAHQLKPGLRFLIHTGSVDYRPSAEIAAIGIRPEHVIMKPVDLNVICRAVRETLKGDR